MHHAVLAAYRLIKASGRSFEDRDVLCDDDLIYELGVTCPATILRMMRLTFFFNICTKTPPMLLA
eukprot:1969809-Karenia_brevis.AAC.1